MIIIKDNPSPNIGLIINLLLQNEETMEEYHLLIKALKEEVGK